LAKAGTPAGLISTTAFQNMALALMKGFGFTGLPLLVIQHPLGGENAEAVARRAAQAVEQLTSLVKRP
jgi:hypothetical protein